MATSKDDIKAATAQAKQSEDESLRVAYKHDTPLEGGKIAESCPVDLFSGAHHISTTASQSQSQSNHETESTGKMPTNAADSTNNNNNNN